MILKNICEMCGDPIEPNSSNDSKVHKGLCKEVVNRGSYDKGRFVLSKVFLDRIQKIIKKQHDDNTTRSGR